MFELLVIIALAAIGKAFLQSFGLK